MGKLSATKVKNARPQPGKVETLFADGDGLSLRVRTGASGSVSKTWVLRYLRPADGRAGKMKLGSYPSMSLQEARKEAEKYVTPLGQGRDPRHVKAAERSKNAAEITMAELFDRWIIHFEQHGGPNSKRAPAAGTVEQHRWRWNKYLSKSLAGLLAKDVDREHLANALDLLRGNSKEQTRKAVATLRLMLGYAETRQLITVSPARLIQPGDFGAQKSRDRTRALSLAELRKLWIALDAGVAPVNPPAGPHKAKTVYLSEVTADVIRVLLLTGARREEVTGMRWNEVDLEAGLWTLPDARTKNRSGHIIYLSPLAVEILRRAESRFAGSDFVFESDRKYGQPIRKDSITKALRRLQGRDIVPAPNAPLHGLEPFSLHDLRRSASTAWGEHLKVWPHVIEKMLNHQPENKLVGVYQRAAYAEEQKAAWMAWGELVAHRVARDPGNVTPITAAKNTAS